MAAEIPWIAEYQALSSGVGVSNLTGRGRIAIRGNDRVHFLHSFCTNDIQRLSPGMGCEAFVTNHQGKTVGHVYVFCTEDALLLDTAPSQAASLISHFDRFVISDDVTFEDVSGATGHWLLAGPHSRYLLAGPIGDELPSQPWDHRPGRLRGIGVQVISADFLLPESFFLVTAAGEFEEVRQTLDDAGARLCGSEAMEAVRIESGTPLFGSDITADNLPQEIGRDAQAISFTKGCYLGQETVARIDAMGHVNRLLAGVRFLDSPAVPPFGTELKSGDKVVGQVTSAAWSPRLSQPLGFALVRRPQAAAGTRLESACGAAEVVRLPLA
ncbi:MAG TPA: glycine cleavage T C-terminal barrel domain-containing protein [Pirellulaceae bacterium]|nr:glycine cleavage T C-terminal barrel domain-containing protein [Pirellulaceae bacterium]